LERARLIGIVALGACVATAVLLAAWALDARAHDGDVLPDVTLAGREVRGYDESELAATIAEVADQFARATIVVEAPAGSFESTIADLGVRVDEEATARAALDAGRQGGLPRRVLTWARNFLASREIGVAIDVDRSVLDPAIVEADPGRVPPTEPFLEVADGQLVAREGTNGEGLDPAVVAERLRRADPTKGRIVVELEPTTLEPRFGVEDAEVLLGRAQGLVEAGLEVSAGGVTKAVPAEVLRGWFQIAVADDGLRLTLDPAADALTDLRQQVLPEAGVAPKPTGFAVQGDAVVLVPSQGGTACCAPESLDVLDTVITRTGQGEAPTGPVPLPLAEVAAPDDEDEARGLGIRQLVSTFTTNHAAGQPRVQNIHRMADTVRGTVIKPGETFSLNGIVGRRTTEKGYVEAGIIGAGGRFDSDVGGGVSQFATTTFNAAFFAGVDITEYFMHTIYFTRYPYGREATVSFPSPDLKWRNTTPYGILVWPTYTDSSITVSFYSTTFVTAEQTGQTTEAFAPRFVPDELRGQPGAEALTCTRVLTERTRTYLDGRATTDTFRAAYAPAEGVLC